MINAQTNLMNSSNFIKKYLNFSPDQTPTTFELINETLDQLPYEIWEDETKIFCDITCGTGTFLLTIFAKCFDGLKYKIPNVQDRIENILSRIYGYDIDEVQILIAKKQFAKMLKNLEINCINLINKVQLIQLDSLKNEFNMKFDVLVGNPPFQPEKSEKKKNGDGQGTSNSIWQFFVEKAISITKDNGYLCFVTPTNWRIGNFSKNKFSDVRNELWKHDLKWIIDARNPKDYFNTIAYSIRVNSWVIQKTNNNTLSFENLKKYNVLPIDKQSLSICDKYLNSFNENTITFMKRDKVNDFQRGVKESNEYCWRVCNTSSQRNKSIFDWVKTKPTSYDIKKVIISDSGCLSPYYDNGSMGHYAHAHAFEVSNEQEGINLVNYINSKVVNYIMYNFMSFGQFDILTQFVSQIPVNVLSLSWDQNNWIESAKKVFDFSNEEIEIIKKFNS